MNKKLQKQINDVLIKITNITRHIRNVQDNCLLLGTKLIEQGEIELGKQLISNGFVHDVSKFYGIEFENLSISENNDKSETKLKLKMAIHQHNSINRHHPEAWSGGIKEMPDVYLAEFCSDIKSRSEEFGTDLRDWIHEIGFKKWNFSKEDEVYHKIMKYVDLLCPKPFEDLTK
jgi:ribosomal protein S8